MRKANSHLAARQPYKAVEVYTEILSSVNRGNPCAFLNRSLAYIALGYPELAVADAYRAAVASSQMRDAVLGPDRYFRAVARYTQAEKFAVRSREPWAISPRCYIGAVWLGMPLAAINLHVDQRPWGRFPRHSICTAIELRAIYRMAYGLWRCGGGALSDALGILSDAIRVYNLQPNEKSCLIALGNAIFTDIENRMGEGNGESKLPDADLIGKPESSSKHDGWKPHLQEVSSQMRRRYTMVRREVYPWNHHEPDLEDAAVVKSLNEDATGILSDIEFNVIPGEEGRMPRLGLFAKKDIQHDNLVMAERSLMNVTSSSIDRRIAYCNVCAAAMEFTEHGTDVRTLDRSTGKPPGTAGNGPSPPSETIYNEETRPEPSSVATTDNDTAMTPPETPPTTSSPRGTSVLRRLCFRCQEAFCSNKCKQEANKQFHQVVCLFRKFNIEESIRVAIQRSPALQDHPVNTEAEQIYELLLTRVFALAKQKSIHVLDMKEIRWLNGDLYTRPDVEDDPERSDSGEANEMIDPALFSPSPGTDDAFRRTLPWSFEANVVRPMKWLTDMDINPVEEVDQCDAWIINTLLAKIMSSARITKGPRQVKVYDASGKLLEESQGSLRDDLGEDAEICVGSIHPVFSHVPIVGKEDVNIAFHDLYGGIVSCRAFSEAGKQQDASSPQKGQ